MMALSTQLIVFLGGLPTSNAIANLKCDWLKTAKPNTKYYDSLENKIGEIESIKKVGSGHVEIDGKFQSSDLIYVLKSDWKGQCPWQPSEGASQSTQSTQISCNWHTTAKLGDRIYDVHANSKRRGVIKRIETTNGRNKKLTVELDPTSTGESAITYVYPEDTTNGCWWQMEDISIFTIEGENDLKSIEENREAWDDDDDDEPEIKEGSNVFHTVKENYKVFFEEHKESLKRTLENHPMNRAAKIFQGSKPNRDIRAWQNALRSSDVKETKEAVSIFAQVVGKQIDIESIQDNVEEVFTTIAKVDALASFLDIDSPIITDLANHVSWLRPALQATRSKKVTVAARHLLQAKMTFLENFLPPGPVTDLIRVPNALLKVLNKQYKDEKITLRKLARDIVPLTVNSVVAVVGNAHLTDARNIFLITERVLREDTLTELDVEDIFVIGAAATRVASTVSLGIFPPASIAFSFVTKALTTANKLGLFQDPKSEAILDDILRIVDKDPLVRSAFDFGQKLLSVWDAFNDGLQAILSPGSSKITFTNSRKIKVLPIGVHIQNGIKTLGNVNQQVARVTNDVIKTGVHVIRNFHRAGNNLVRNVTRTAVSVVERSFRPVVAVAGGIGGAVGNILGSIIPKRRRRNGSRR